MNNTHGPVFIIGGSRTGSELHKNIVSRYTDIDLVPEMWLQCPQWLHTDLEQSIRKELGAPEKADIEALIDFLYSQKPFGIFWKRIGQDIPRERLLQSVEEHGKDIRGLFLAIMQAHAEAMKKQRLGAKFPLHYSRAELLLQWFPDCKLIHTMRDPRAVYASQARKYYDPAAGKSANAWMAFKQFVHINLQFMWTVSVHRKLQGNPNYILSRYEDVITSPEPALRRLCDFLEVPFEEEMTRPNVWYNSSYRDESKGPSGLSDRSLKAWKARLGKKTIGIMNAVNGSRLAEVGYEL